MKKYFSLLIVSLFFSCSIEQHIHVKADGSGYVRMKFDFSAFMAFKNLDLPDQLKMVDTNALSSDEIIVLPEEEVVVDEENDLKNDDFSLDNYFEQIKNNFELTPGIKNVVLNYDSVANICYIKYEFVNISALSKVNSLSGDLTETAPLKSAIMSKEKKSFSYAVPNKDNSNSSDINFGSNVISSSLGDDVMKYTMIFSFDQKIKSFNNKNYQVSSDGKTVTYTGNLSLLALYPELLSIKIKLK